MPSRAHLIRSACIGLGLALATLCAAPSRAQDGVKAEHRGEAPAVAIAAELTGQPGGSRLTLVLSKAIEARAFVMERPDRAVIDLPEVNFQLDAETGRRRDGLVQSFRYGLFAPGRSRIVIDLAAPATVGRIETATRPRDGAVVLTIPLQRVDRDAFRKAAAVSDPAPAQARAPAAEPSDQRPLIVVDAGHGGTDPGAIAAGGVFEKDIVFGFAQDLADKLRAAGRYRVQMTRDRDVFVPLGERVRIARDAKADLFVSIHADSISAAPQVRGATIYTGSEKATDAESAKLAERENRADAAAGADTAEAPPDIADILQELTLRETRGFSAGFARNLMKQLSPVIEMSVKPHREAGFKVLRSPDVPSVLVELGYLSSKRDLEMLQNPEWRAGVTGSMAKAIDLFFAGRATLGRPASGTRRAAAIAPVSP
ncbi:N-acetylmuramoyl-L-alanine amidase [Methylobacterium sp. NEAU 140]|uniref:N-acetylmuramoyl-L-alanine amidase n=1 Tax=Methylobacterium sp. NEAU 140 TaxID=3064945 RepID=UPI0027357DA2|nr:N-acetylmuramoyl-L-alanine amidase [Methylobacterium sp. NEAU 140]MDP4021677.1 N-acetylmuramoyl-L-alanine amidase [Methylobacterium sp. NEAU 140]